MSYSTQLNWLLSPEWDFRRRHSQGWRGMLTRKSAHYSNPTLCRRLPTSMMTQLMLFCEFPSTFHMGAVQVWNMRQACLSTRHWQLLDQRQNLPWLRTRWIFKSNFFFFRCFCLPTGSFRGTDIPTVMFPVFLSLCFSPPDSLLPLVLHSCTTWLRAYTPLELSVGRSHLAHGVKAITHTNTSYTIP